MFSVGRYFLSGQREEGESSGGNRSSGFVTSEGCRDVTIEDGRSIPLTGTAIIKERGGQVIENDSAKVLDYTGVREKEVEPVYNKITVPTGASIWCFCPTVPGFG